LVATLINGNKTNCPHFADMVLLLLKFLFELLALQ